MVEDPLVMPLATELLECYEQELAKLADPPESIGIRPGTVVDFLLSTSENECCSGLAWVRPAAFFPNSGVPTTQDEIPPVTGVTGWSVTLELGIVVCSPTPDETSIPSNEEWLAVTQQVYDAGAAMRRAICCFIEADSRRTRNVLPGIWQPVATQGGCTGGILPVTVRGPACDCRDVGPLVSS